MKTTLALFICLISASIWAQIVNVGYDVHFEQNAIIIGESPDHYSNGNPVNESGWVFSRILEPSDCFSWESEDYWDTLGSYFHNETSYSCISSNENLLNGLNYSEIFTGWEYTTNFSCLVWSVWDANQPVITTKYELSISNYSDIWVDWSNIPFSEPRITTQKPEDFGKWAWDGSINPNYVEPVGPLKSTRGKHLGKQAK